MGGPPRPGPVRASAPRKATRASGKPQPQTPLALLARRRRKAASSTPAGKQPGPAFYDVLSATLFRSTVTSARPGAGGVFLDPVVLRGAALLSSGRGTPGVEGGRGGQWRQVRQEVAGAGPQGRAASGGREPSSLHSRNVAARPPQEALNGPRSQVTLRPARGDSGLRGSRLGGPSRSARSVFAGRAAAAGRPRTLTLGAPAGRGRRLWGGGPALCTCSLRPCSFKGPCNPSRVLRGSRAALGFLALRAPVVSSCLLTHGLGPRREVRRGRSALTSCLFILPRGGYFPTSPSPFLRRVDLKGTV